MLRFEQDIFLFALVFAPVIIAMYIAVVKWKANTVARIGDKKLVEQLIQGYSHRRFRFKFILVLLAFILTAMGVSNLQYPKQMEQVNRQGIDVMIALDVSKSMLAQDVQPDRLQRARLLVTRLIDRLQNDRVGLVLFAGRAYLQMPLTSDHSAAKMYVNTASTQSVPTQGTVIAEALTTCNNAFDEKQKKYKAVILITDGEDHDPNALETAGKMVEEGVVIHTIGVGSTSGSQIVDPDTKELKRMEDGSPVVSRLNEKELMDLANKGHGTYQLLVETDAAVNKILEQINGMEKKSVVDKSLIQYRSFFQWFLALALILLITEMLYPERKNKKQ
jgi:Ca-activated chloride channel family protein